MTPEEAIKLCRLAKAAFPATTVDDFTPDAWVLALEDDRFEDAREALKQLMREQTFIHVSDIVTRMRRIRNERISAFGPLPAPPREIADDEVAYRRWLRETTRAIGDGEAVEFPALAAGTPKPKELDFTKVFRSVPPIDDEPEESA